MIQWPCWPGSFGHPLTLWPAMSCMYMYQFGHFLGLMRYLGVLSAYGWLTFVNIHCPASPGSLFFSTDISSRTVFLHVHIQVHPLFDEHRLVVAPSKQKWIVIARGIDNIDYVTGIGIIYATHAANLSLSSQQKWPKNDQSGLKMAKNRAFFKYFQQYLQNKSTHKLKNMLYQWRQPSANCL